MLPEMAAVLWQYGLDDYELTDEEGQMMQRAYFSTENIPAEQGHELLRLLERNRELFSEAFDSIRFCEGYFDSKGSVVLYKNRADECGGRPSSDIRGLLGSGYAGVRQTLAQGAAQAAPLPNCDICLEEFGDTRQRAVFHPCGHARTCWDCAQPLLAGRHPCPQCRRPIQRMSKLYL
jgi:hypothetical protein